MKHVFYKKVGRRYVPISEYDNDLMDAFPYGSTLVTVKKGSSSRRFHVDANYAALIAAGTVAEDAICDAFREASQPRPQKTPLTERQIKAWRKLAKELKDENGVLVYPSYHDLAEAGVKAMREEAAKLMTHPSVRNAYDQFMMVCKLVKEDQNGN